MLQLRNITKTYKVGNGRIVALDKINIDFPEKGLVFIVGKSGSGKSTLLNILGGLDKMDNGEIIINGKSTSDFSSSDFDAYRNYHIGFIFQEFNLIEDISVKENIAIALKMQSKGHDATTIDEALKLVHLEGLGYRTPKELSGGQKQRIAIARALVKNPNIILADEPTGALDSKTGYELMSSLKTLSENKLIIVVTHDFEMANIFGDEIIKLTDGVIIDHLIISPNYVRYENEKISQNIIKISSGNKIKDASIINDCLNKDSTNYICLTTQPETITIAYPETYEQIFKPEDLSSKFISKHGKLQDIIRDKKTNSKQKAKIEFKECFKMALHHFKTSKGKFLFLLIFTIISFSLLGLTYSLSQVDNDKIIANTLSNNDMELGIMEKYGKYGKVIFNKDDINSLKDNNSDTNFAIGKTVNINYTSGSKPSQSSFAMGSFKGIVECNDVTELNLNIIEGIGSFDKDSLANNEIIISDYAAFELRRTGYLGRNNQGDFGLIKPETLSEQINSTIMLNSTEYKIIGIFDTNYEDFLPLLVSEVYVDDQDQQASSLNALKSYYYARIFGPYGLYKQYIDNSGNSIVKSTFNISANKIPVYEYDEENGTVIDAFTPTDYTYNLSTFYDFNDVRTDSQFKYTVKWGEIPSVLKDNQVILSYSWLAYNGITEPAQIDKAIDALENNIVISKMLNNNTVDTVICDKQLDVVAIIDAYNNGSYDYYSTVPVYFSSEYKNMLTNSIYSYDQILFTLDGSKIEYAKTISDFNKQGYSVLNIDGYATYGAEALYSIKAIISIATIVMFMFSLLIMFNYSANNIKLRKKEIGILRATGARGRDVVKIFAVEEGILASIVSLASIIIIAILTSLINNSFGNMQIGIQLIVLSILDILLIVSSIFLVYGLTTIIPVISVARMKPIEAIRKI